MSEGPDRQVEAANTPEIEDRLLDWIRDALYRLQERGYGRPENVTIQVGNEVWYELQGAYFEIEENAQLTFEGNPVLKNMELPDYRILLIDESAMVDYEFMSGPSAFNDPEADMMRQPTVVTGKKVGAPEGIEFVPETEVYYGDGV